MTYVDEIESDLSRYHGLDLWSVSFHRVMRLAGKLPAYGGALALAMGREQKQPDAPTALAPAAELSTDHPHPVRSSVQRGGLGKHAVPDTPPEVVAQLWEQALLKQYPGAVGVRQVSAEEMEGRIRGS